MENVKKKFEGKKLLLLGTNTVTCDIVNYAKSQGAYVIVTDNLSPQKSAAKLIADETWMVSTADVDTLERLAKKNKISGIFAGASEFNLEKVMTLCERLELPFYSTRKQWEICSNKLRFKQLCRDNGVPVTKDYRIDKKSEDLRYIKYPVIVKPVDCSGGTGIGICRNEHELLKAHEKAVSLSKTYQAVIEEFVEGDEFMVAYTVNDGQFSVTITEDRFLTPEPNITIPLPQAAIFPSKHTDRYLGELNDKVIKMFESIGIANGFIFIQGIIDNEGFHFFETNYRLAGSHWYLFTSRINGTNYMEMMVDYALTGKMNGDDLRLDNPKFPRFCCTLPLISKGGLVGEIMGLDNIKNKKSLIAVYNSYKTGDYVEKSGTLRQLHVRLFLMEDTIEELKHSIKQIQDTVKVLDDKGNDMLLPSFNTDRIKTGCCL
jgi:biotin carboxylase